MRGCTKVMAAQRVSRRHWSFNAGSVGPDSVDSHVIVEGRFKHLNETTDVEPVISDLISTYRDDR